MLRQIFGARSTIGKALLAALRPLHPPEVAAKTTFALLLRMLEHRFGPDSGAEALEVLARLPSPDQLVANLDSELEPLDVRLAELSGMPEAIALAADKVRRLELPVSDPFSPYDWLGPLYQDLLSGAARRFLGAHYTPPWVVEYLFSHSSWPGGPSARLLDPACGSGMFLLWALARYRKAFPQMDPRAWLDQIAGIDVQPSAVRAARLNLAMALRDLSAPPSMDSSVVLADALALLPPTPPLDRPVTHVLSNPPWISWEHLPEERRFAARDLWESEGLFVHKAWRARMGAGKKDLSMLFVSLTLSRWLGPGGEMGLVLPRSLASSAAAAGLRRSLRAGSLELTCIEDLSQLKVFPGAAAPTLLVFGRRASSLERQTRSAAIPWLEWRLKAGARLNGSLEDVLKKTHRERLVLEPGSGDSADAPWLPVQEGLQSTLDRITGRSAYKAWEGANTGGANGILWVKRLDEGADETHLVRIRNLPERGRRPVPSHEALVESRFVWPLLRGRNVTHWLAVPDGQMILVQDPEKRQGFSLDIMEQEGPNTLQFLEIFRAELSARPLYLKYFPGGRAPWYSIYNVGAYTLAPWKVVWREQSAKLTAAVVGPEPDRKVPIPDHKLMFVACNSSDEAHYLCAVLNSPLLAALAARICTKTSIGPHLLEHLAVPEFDPASTAHHNLSQLSMSAHRARAMGQVFSWSHTASAEVAVVFGLKQEEMAGLVG